MITIRRYSADLKGDWDNLVLNSKIDSFLFMRDYMDYHSSRFSDCSFMIFKKNKLVALLPGNLDGSSYYSHQGLSYGGLLCNRKVTATDTLEFFYRINEFLNSLKVRKVIYKATPYIYHLIPSQEDIYALYRLGARQIECNVSSVINQTSKIPFTESRKSGLRKAITNNVEFKTSEDFEKFWPILEKNLNDQHGINPKHSLKEILLLKGLFPNQIKLHVTEYRNSIVGGCLVYIMKNVVRVQYISASNIGKKIGALDLLFNELINKVYTDKQYFDFGHSNENDGKYLNKDLIFQKEGFGGRGVVFETYQYDIGK